MEPFATGRACVVCGGENLDAFETLATGTAVASAPSGFVFRVLLWPPIGVVVYFLDTSLGGVSYEKVP